MEDTIIQILAWVIVAGILIGIFFFIRGTWRMLKEILGWLWELITGKKAGQVTPELKLNAMNKYLRLDPEFDEGEIRTLIADFYVKEHLHGEDSDNVRPYLIINLRGWRQSGGRDYIHARLTHGRKNFDVELSRKAGVLTAKESRSSICPHCGAPLELNESGKCEYCGSVIKNAGTDWTLNSIK